MKILFYTIDMVDGVERLMPWRTVVEIESTYRDRDYMKPPSVLHKNKV